MYLDVSVEKVHTYTNIIIINTEIFQQEKSTWKLVTIKADFFVIFFSATKKNVVIRFDMMISRNIEPPLDLFQQQ